MMLELLIGLYNVGWAIINAYNFYPLIRARKKERVKLEELNQKELPKISVLLPAYKEGTTLEKCIETLFDSDYPQDKLELILLTEKDDEETRNIAKKLEKIYKEKGYAFKHLEIEETEEPKGKPRALNQGLKHAQGDVVGVIDAEDIIDPTLFKEVAYKIKREGFDAVQGILDMMNDYDGWKNCQFRGEYSYWFRRYLPALEKSGLPVPLGGTANFIKRDVLEELGGWDSYNLTEDFDLGLRLYYERKRTGVTKSITKRDERGIFEEKYKVGILNLVTREESPITWKAWLRQRTRWQRGKIQTLKKLLKKPPSGIKRKFHSFMSCFSPHLGPMNLSGLALSVYAFLTHAELPFPIRELAYANFAAIGCYMYMQSKGYLDATENEKRSYRKLKALWCGITLPFYWMAQWIADLRAIKQEYIDKKIFWEKTEHKGRHLKIYER